LRLEFAATIDLQLLAEKGHPKVLDDVARLVIWEAALLGLTDAQLKIAFRDIKADAGYYGWDGNRQLRFRQTECLACKVFRYWDLLPVSYQLELIADDVPVSTLAHRIDDMVRKGLIPRRRGGRNAAPLSRAA
jgi:hypothetical protein